MVFVHGSLDEGASFRRCADLLSDRPVITYDRRGWGRSAHLGIGDVRTNCADLASILRVHGPALIVGHSLGGTVALTLAANHPELALGVLAYEPPLPWLPWWPRRAPWELLVLDEGRPPADAAEALVRAVIGDAEWQRLPPAVREHRRGAGECLIVEMASLCGSPPTFQPEQVVCPVIAAAGGMSVEHHVETCRRLAHLLPHGQYREIKTAGHPAHVTHANAFVALLERDATHQPPAAGDNLAVRPLGPGSARTVRPSPSTSEMA